VKKGCCDILAELEDRNRFAELLFFGVTALRRHSDYKVKRKRRESLPSGQFVSESYLDKLGVQLGISSNTIKSWMGQMGQKYVPSRIEDGKLFGIIWLILEKSDMDVQWLTEFLQTTSIPIIKPALPVWVASCLKNGKLLREYQSFGAPCDEEIERVVRRLFQNDPSDQNRTIAPKPLAHNLPTRWLDVFIGRNRDLETIRQWMLSPSPVCLITGWGGMGKTTIALESAYACVDASRNEATSGDIRWPSFTSVIWVSAELNGLSLSDFLDTIAYQLGQVEIIGKSVNEKRLIVRNTLAALYQQLLLIIDSIDSADREIQEFLTNLPQGIKVMLTSRENQHLIYGNASREIYTIPLEGLPKNEALDYLVQVVRRHIRMGNSPRKQEKLGHLLNESSEVHEQLIISTAGNPKAIALSIAYIVDDDIAIKQLIQEIEKASYSLTALFEYLFGHIWKRCNEDTRVLWQILCFFNKPPEAASWAAAAGLDARSFHHAVEQMRDYALIESESVNGQLYYRGHQLVVAFGEQNLSENQILNMEARKRWGQYYLNYLDTHLKRDKPNVPYWNFLLGRALDKIKQEWPNLFKLIQWADMTGQPELLTELMVRLSHFLSRVSLPLRIEYGLKAADAAHQIANHTLEALFRIDTVGWAYTEIGNLEEGLYQVESGLQELDGLNSEDTDVRDLRVLGLVFKSRIHLKIRQFEYAAVLLKEALEIPSTVIIRHRALLVQGDLSLLNGEYEKAVLIYEEANYISRSYGGEKTIEAYFNLGIAYLKCGQVAKAESEFEHMLYDQTTANQIELIYYQYGLAQMLASKGDIAAALKLTERVLSLIDSWEQNIGLRNEVEEFNKKLKNASEESTSVMDI
jgi:LuxR family glucitol operon transcriptional activator